MIGIFGGTFDPIHNGHVSVIENFLDLVELDELIVIPNGNPPHKEKITKEKDKFEMVKLALDHIRDLKLDNREISKVTSSYAYSTSLELQKENPEATLVWIMGTDSFMNIESWYCYEEFINSTNFLILERPGYEIEKESVAHTLLKSRKINKFEGFRNNKGKIFLLKINPIKITSTHIRKMISCNEDAASFLDPSVYDYIKENNLYKDING